MEQLTKLEYIAHSIYLNELKDKGLPPEKWAEMSKGMKLLYRSIAQISFNTWKEEQKPNKKNG